MTRFCPSCGEEIEPHHATNGAKHTECARFDRDRDRSLDEVDRLLAEKGLPESLRFRLTRLPAPDAWENRHNEEVAEIVREYEEGGGE